MLQGRPDGERAVFLFLLMQLILSQTRVHASGLCESFLHFTPLNVTHYGI